MKILLLGEYSNVHSTLAEGLRQRGHEVLLASNGDFWKDYPRDIDLRRHTGPFAGLRLYGKILRLLPTWRDYDIVQLINPLFFELRAERHFSLFRRLKEQNHHIVLGAFGMDYYWVHENTSRMPLRYSDFNIGHRLRTDTEAIKYTQDWLNTKKETLNRLIATEADHIVTGLYEYDACYRPNFPDKTTFIPLPIKSSEEEIKRVRERVRVLVGVSKGRNAYKGTDVMLRAAQTVQQRHPQDMELIVVEGLPFKEYQQLISNADILLDQLYSYTPAMNALEAMSQGVVVVGGGEEENYSILGETELRPIINVQPTEDSVCEALESLITHPDRLPSLKEQSKLYVKRHHDYLAVAQKYEEMYLTL